MDLTERTQHYYSCVDAGNVDGVLDWFADDAVYQRGGYAPMVGRAALAEFYGGERVIESGAHTLEQILVDGESAAVRDVFNGRLNDDSDTSVGFADFITYNADGRAQERRSYFFVGAV